MTVCTRGALKIPPRLHLHIIAIRTKIVRETMGRGLRFVLSHLFAAALTEGHGPVYADRVLNEFSPHRIEEPLKRKKSLKSPSEDILNIDFSPIADLKKRLLREFPAIGKKRSIRFYIHEWKAHGRFIFKTVRQHFSMILRLNRRCNSGPTMGAFLRSLGIETGCYCTANGIMLAVMYRIGHRVGIVAEIINGKHCLTEIEIFLTKDFEIMDAPLDNLFKRCNWDDYLLIVSL